MRAARRWRWSCPANIGESDDSRRKMSDGRVVEDVSGVEWDNKRTTATGGEQEVGRICEEGRNNSCCGRNGTTEEPEAEKACIRNAPLARPRKTPTRSRSRWRRTLKNGPKLWGGRGWTYKMLITSEISVQRYRGMAMAASCSAFLGVQRTVPHIPGFVSSACTVL